MLKINIAVCSTLILSSLPVSAHGGATLPLTKQAAPVPITTTDLGNGIFMLQGRGGNIGVLTGPDGIFVIDSQYADMAPGILNAIDNIAADRPRYVVNTHWHGDHVGGNAILSETGATIIAHEGVRERVSVDVTRDFFGQETTTPAAPANAWPVITFDRQMTLYLNGQTVRLIHTPSAHTDGDTFVYFEEANILHTGDLMFNGLFPFIDLTSGGTVDGYAAATQAMDALADANTQIIPGHGPIATKADFQATLAMLAGTQAAVEAEINAGKDIEAVLDAEPLAPWVDDWAWGFINEPRFTRILYADIMTRRAD